MTQLNEQFATAADKKIRFFSNIQDFALWLASIKGNCFLSFDAVYDFTAKGKMLVKNRDTKEANPYISRKLKKYSTTQVTCSFNYEDKVERRGGELPTKEGNWIQAFLLNNKPTPLAVHKADIVTAPKDGATPNAKGDYNYADLVAVLSPDGNVQLNTDTPRLYLRYEIVRAGDAENRADKKMRSTSFYRCDDGEIIDKKVLEPYLPAEQERVDQTDYQVAALANIVELRANGEVWRRREATLPTPVTAPVTV